MQLHVKNFLFHYDLKKWRKNVEKVDNGAPGPRPLYGPKYYGAFVIYKGHKLEAMFYDWKYTDMCQML